MDNTAISTPYNSAKQIVSTTGSGSVRPRSLSSFEMTNAYLVVIPGVRLCENTVHGSTKLTTNGVVSLEIKYLSVRPEPRRRAQRAFLHSLAERGIVLDVKSHD